MALVATTRKSFGLITIEHKNRLITTSVGAVQYEDQFCGLLSDDNYPNKIGSIPAGFAHRPDLIANLWLNSPGLWWLICERNNITDVFEQLKLSDRIYLPI